MYKKTLNTTMSESTARERSSGHNVIDLCDSESDDEIEALDDDKRTETNHHRNDANITANQAPPPKKKQKTSEADSDDDSFSSNDINDEDEDSEDEGGPPRSNFGTRSGRAAGISTPNNQHSTTMRNSTAATAHLAPLAAATPAATSRATVVSTSKVNAAATSARTMTTTVKRDNASAAATGPPVATPRRESLVSDPEPSQETDKDNSFLDDLKCPILLDFPIDPVTADDGHTYERYAIEQWLKEKKESPLTRKKISTKLVPNLQARKLIESSIENGSITGEVAERWKERFQQHKAMKELLAQANRGDVDAMLKAGSNYHGGLDGFPTDEKEAFSWYEKARFKGSIVAMAEMGDMLVIGDGIDQDEPRGLAYLGRAAGEGSDLAAYALGTYYADGDHGLPVDKFEAIELLQKALSDDCKHVCMNDEAREKAREKLYEVLEGET